MTAHDTIFAVTLSLILAMGSTADAQRVPPSGMVDDKIEPAVKRHVAKTLTFRHQIHQNPELGNCEYETAKLVENHLRALGIEVRSGVLALFTVGDVYASLCKRGAYTLFSAQRSSRAPFWL